MASVLGIIIIAAISYLGSIYVFSKEKLPTPIRYLFYSGWEFILLGMAIGPLALNFLPEEIIGELDPVIHLGLGWAGLIFGIQLRYKKLALLDRRHLTVTVLQAVLTGALAAAVVAPMMIFAREWSGGGLVVSVTVLAAASALSSPTVFMLVRKETGFKERAIRLLQVITALDAVVAIIAVGVVFSVMFPGSGSVADGIFHFSQAIGIGILLGFIFYLFPRKELSENEQMVVILGFVFLSSGIGGALQVSPLFLNLVCGIFLANTLKQNDTVHKALFHTEKPFYIIMLVISGLLFTPLSPFGFLIAIALVAARLAGKTFFLTRLVKRFEPGFDIPSNSGLALASQGAMALTIGLSLLTVQHGDVQRTVFSIIVTCVMINEMAAPFLAAKVFKEKK